MPDRKMLMIANAPETGRGYKSVPRRPRGVATKSASRRGGRGTKQLANRVRCGRKPGSRNKNPRKDKGAKKGRRAPPGMLVAELRKSISK